METKADLGTELKLQWAFQCRGIAFDQCRLLNWAVHDKWLQTLLNAMTRECPTGYQRVKSEQIIRADREMWTLLAQLNLTSLKPVADVPVLDAHVTTLMTDPRITMFLLPLLSSHSASGAKADKPVNKTPPPPPPAAGNRPRQNTLKKTRRPLTRAQKACVEELRKFVLRILEGPFTGPICFNYNMKQGCSNSTTSENGCSRCMKGLHLCANCHKPGHSVLTCRALAPAKSS